MVADFREKPQDSHDWINGGYFVVEPDVLDLIEDDSVSFEAAPLSRLAQQGRLGAYQHEGFWMPMDTVRERDERNKIWNSGNAAWWNKQ
jgi:glucose-1-phosphate cytidylyltransferase